MWYITFKCQKLNLYCLPQFSQLRMLSAYCIAGSNELYCNFKIVRIAFRLSLLGRNRLQWFDTSRQYRPRDSSDSARLQAAVWRMWLLWNVAERTDQYASRLEEHGISELKNSSSLRQVDQQRVGVSITQMGRLYIARLSRHGTLTRVMNAGLKFAVLCMINRCIPKLHSH